jgi:Protein of unknown function (DUF2924)
MNALSSSGNSFRKPAPSVAQDLTRQLAALQQLSLTELRAEWRRLFRTQPPTLSRDLVVRAIAYRLQELAHGGLARATARKLATLAEALKDDGEIRIDPGPQIKPGARLVREWRGRTHTVTVTEEGFDYAGRNYPSLTKIARAITGAHWSGPRFFGLKRSAREAAAQRTMQAPPRASHSPAKAGHA